MGLVIISASSKLRKYIKSISIGGWFIWLSAYIKTIRNIPMQARAKILAVTYWDWANTLYRYCKCLEYLNLDFCCIKGQPSSNFLYPFEVSVYIPLTRVQPSYMHPIVINAPHLNSFFNQFDIIWFSAETFINTGIDLSCKKVIVDYRGQTYLKNMEACQSVFNQFSDVSIISWLPLYGYGLNNEQLVLWAVDTDFIKPSYKNGNGKLVIGHFPSTVENKGSNTILDVINELKKEYGNKFEYVGSDKKEMIWINNLKRMSSCDVIIETLKPELHNKPLGDWSNTTLEASALGKIIISNFRNEELYKREYGNHEVCIANDAEQLTSVLVNLIENYTLDMIIDKQIATRKWVEEKHSIPATANRLYDKVIKNLLI